MRFRAWWQLPVLVAAGVAACSGDNLTLPAGGVAAKVVGSAGDGQSAVVGTSVATPPAVLVTDARDAPVSGASVTFQVTAGGGSVQPATAVQTDAAGLATLTSWTLGAAAGVNQLTATVEGSDVSGNPVTFRGTGVGIEANRLVFVVQPTSGTANTPISPPVQVQVQDASGAPITSAAVSIGIALGANPGGATLTGGNPVIAVNGTATFSNLRVSQGGSGFTLAAFASGYVSGASAPFNVVGTGGGGGGGPTATTTAVSSSANPSTFGQSVTFTARVTSTGATPTGSVQFKIDGDNFGSAVPLASGSAQSQGTSSLTPGTHAAQAVYAPSSSSFASSTGSLTQTVSGVIPTMLSLSTSPNPSTVGTAVTMTATVTSSTLTPNGTVSFFEGACGSGTPLGSGDLSATGTGIATATASVSTLATGQHTLTGCYPGNGTFGPSQGTQNQTVN